MNRRAIPYSAEERAWLQSNCTLPIADYTQAFNDRFGREVAAKNLHALRKRNGWKTGRSGKFTKGAAPANKGKPCQPGRSGNHPNARATQFKPGTRNGVALQRYKPIGSVRMSADGYEETKIHDGMPLQSRWRLTHLVRWEKLNGPLPAGHCLKCIDSNRLNTDPSNWALIPRSALPHLGPHLGPHRGIDYDSAPAEVKPAILTLAKLKTAARTKARTS